MAEESRLVAPVGEWLAPYQPSQRYILVDERRLQEDDLPARNLMRAMAGLEQSRSVGDLRPVVARLLEWLGNPGDEELRRAFAQWLWALMQRPSPGEAEGLGPVRTLEGVRMTLEERVAEWPRQWLREGIEQGIEQGLKQQRALLCRQAMARFGADTAERLSEVLAGIADQEILAQVGDSLVRCGTGREFVAHAVLVTNADDEDHVRLVHGGEPSGIASSHGSGERLR